MTGEIPSKNTFERFYLIDELNMLVIAALWSGNTPQHEWLRGKAGAEKLAHPEGFRLKLDELSDAVARFKLAESSFNGEKDIAEYAAEPLKNAPTMYLVPTKFQKKRHLIRPPKDSPSDPKNFLPEPLRTTITRKELARYAIATEQNPDFLDRDIKALRPELDLEKPVPPYLDRDHPNFAKELCIAVKLWENLCMNLERKPQGGMAKFLEDELRENYGHLDLSEDAIERIRIVANPNRFKRDGKSKSKKK